ncbi:MAG: 3-hydroxyacyl-CoA dehydrogenase family protein [Ignavibacteria bacterium]|nr:3-hydroxyacyl-CoA dehydrogenase family protein [Ignavibacteria bacterium]
MYKVFISGDRVLKEEIKTFLKSKAEFSDKIDNETDIIIEATNYPASEKFSMISETDINEKKIPVFTSSLCVTVWEQIPSSKYPERLIGIGLYNTFSENGFVEIAPSRLTDPEILDKAEKFLKDLSIGYSVVPDRVGLIFPRVISMIINEAAQLYSEKIASKEDIDTAMKLGTNYPYGPLEWADRLGIGLVTEILSALQKHFGEDRYRVHPLLKEMSSLGLKFY